MQSPWQFWIGDKVLNTLATLPVHIESDHFSVVSELSFEVRSKLTIGVIVPYILCYSLYASEPIQNTW
jgi:hypothetical protein